jgi:hypothetical protein
MHTTDSKHALPSADQSPWLGMEHESQGQLLGQYGDGALVLETEDGASLATRLRQRRRSDARRYWLHRGLLQQHPIAFNTGLPTTLRLRTGIGR